MKILCAWIALGAQSVSGLIFYESANPPANTETAPTGVYANAGWQHQVVVTRGASQQFYFGTIISPKHFVTARHLGIGVPGTEDQIFVTQPDYITGTVEKVYTLRNATAPRAVQYVESGTLVTENTDLFIYEIWESFSSYSELYSGTNEIGKELVITGFGDSRGTPVVSAEGERGWGPDTTARKGRWGTNSVDGTIGFTEDATQGLFLYCDFDAQGVIGDSLDPDDADATTHEAQAANRDSGGGWFIKDRGVWKLAAINFGVDTYGTSQGVTGSRWAIYDGVGLYHGNSEAPIEACTNSGCDFFRRSHTYATRISEHVVAMNAVIQPAKDTAALPALGRFEVWTQEHGLASGETTDGDADNDGLSQLEEYLTESDPNDGDEAVRPLVVEVLADGTHQFTLVESLDLTGRGLTTALQSSSDLATWTAVGDVTESSNTLENLEGVRSRVLTRTPFEAGALYYRLKITLSPS